MAGHSQVADQPGHRGTLEGCHRYRQLRDRASVNRSFATRTYRQKSRASPWLHPARSIVGIVVVNFTRRVSTLHEGMKLVQVWIATHISVGCLARHRRVLGDITSL